MLRLVARCGDQIRFYPLPADGAIVGSAPESGVLLPFPGVSRSHARCHRVGADLLLVDLGSKNGLRAVDRRLPQVLLAPGGEVGIGRVRLTLEKLDSAEGEVALVFETGRAGSLTPPASTVTVPGPRQPAEAALHFIRRLEGSGSRLEPGAPALAEAWRLLGAATLLAFHATDGGAAVLDCQGPLPSDKLARFLAEAPPGDHQVSGAGSTTVLIRGAGGGPLRLAAVFTAGSPAAWQRDFFEYLALRLGLPLPPPASDTAAPVLRLPPEMIVGASPALAALLADLALAARGRLDVLLTGETGTGKELLARALHDSGPTPGGPFVAVNCAAIPGELAEAELFGIQARAATGVDARPGLFVQADGGTLFLDEIGELALPLQAKLLRVLQEREVLPLGAGAPRRLTLRVVAASNRDLAAMAAAGTFRLDLYHRLRGIAIRVPALRERRDDLPGLLTGLAAQAAAHHGKQLLGISRRALDRLLAWPWPGNVRELQALVERAVLACPDGGVLESAHLQLPEPEALAGQILAEPSLSSSPPIPPTLQEQIEALERDAILQALAASGGNKTRAARQLGLTRNGLALKMQRLGLRAGQG